MREWGLTAEAPLPLRISADARLSVPDYVNDQIWELRLGGGSPPSLTLQTSYGRRARSMRIFPGFRLDQDTWIDPLGFHSPPTVSTFLPNYVRLSFEPFPMLTVVAEYWAKESYLIGGRFTLHNIDSDVLAPELLLHAQLLPEDHQQPMASVSNQGAIVLQGTTEELAPLLFISGGPRAAIAPYPALSLRPSLNPGASETYTWAHAACSSLQESFSEARALMAVKWDPEISRIEQANAGLVEVKTDDPDWDVAFALAQTVSVAAFVGPTRHMPHASIVLDRVPTRGYSAHPDGRDYEPSWDGASAFDTYISILQLLPSAPELAQGLVLNFLASQMPDGIVDGKQGLGGKSSGLQCAPILASLAWRTYTHTQDIEFLSDVYPRLLGFIDSWFDEMQDHDQDGFPEWKSSLHAGFEDWPAFNRLHRWGQGLDLALAETPDLSSYLFREIRALIEMGKVLEQAEREQDLASRQMLLREVIERTWSEKEHCYLAQDRDLDTTVVGSRISIGQGEYEISVDEEFDPQIRLIARVQGEGAEKSGIKISVRGKVAGSRKRIHHLTGADFLWVDGLGNLTTQFTFSQISKIEIQGVAQDTRTEIRIADYSRPDHTGLLPLWAGVPDKERADQMIKNVVTNESKYWREYGLPTWPADGLASRYARVHIRPNLMIGEGLVDYGYLKEAAELVERLMKTCINSLHLEDGFRECYLPDRPGGSGKRGHSSGVAPLSLFLDVLGVRLISPYKIALRGHNPFKRPIQIRHRGIEVSWDENEARIRFPDGAETTVTGKEVQIVELADR